jgi:methylamine---glutamate N-methyltransferase subunit A
MCGIAGLFLKDERLQPELGGLFAPMLIELTDRGPDSAGIALYGPAASGGRIKLTLFHPDPGFDWRWLAAEHEGEIEAHASHAVLTTEEEPGGLALRLEASDPDLQVMSVGRRMEIYKEVGFAAAVTARFAIERRAGSHAIGHTRMATESAVTTAGSHPFSTGRDLCLVHNGSLSNHNRLRALLARRDGIRFRTENDTEVAAAYVQARMGAGRDLKGALTDALADLDGFYTFTVGTETGFAVLRDPIACKPAVMAETGQWVAMASEYRALSHLPGIEVARVWEPEPATVYSWGRAPA